MPRILFVKILSMGNVAQLCPPMSDVAAGAG